MIKKGRSECPRYRKATHQSLVQDRADKTIPRLLALMCLPSPSLREDRGAPLQLRFCEKLQPNGGMQWARLAADVSPVGLIDLPHRRVDITSPETRFCTRAVTCVTRSIPELAARGLQVALGRMPLAVRGKG